MAHQNPHKANLFMSAPIPVVDNPIPLYRDWLEEARALGVKYPNGISLATVDETGLPSVRMVLLKEFDERGIVFYTNMESDKGRHLLASGKAAVCSYWEPLDKQVRLRGTVEQVSEERADAYFHSRPRISRLGAWASRQSIEIEGRHILEARLREAEEKYPGDDIPRPPYWTGFLLVPSEVEFWREGPYRLHDRLLYVRDGDGWKAKVLSP